MCKEPPRYCFIDCVVTSNYTDSQVGRRHDELTSSVLELCRDTDELAYGGAKVVIVDSLFIENLSFY